MIIIDDGSKDGGVKIVEQYVAKDNRIQLYKQANGGSAAARNNGIRRAKGQYVALLDADDLWHSDFLEKQIKLMNDKQVLLVYSSHSRINENNIEILEPYIAPEKVNYNSMLKTCSISCLTGLYDTSVYGKVFLREEFKSLRDDYVYWLEIIKKVKIAFGNKEVLAKYRMLSNSATRKKKKVIIPQFKVYYNVEKLGLLKSIYYTIHWGIHGYLKYNK